MQTVKAEDIRWSADCQGEWLNIRYPAPKALLEGLEPGKEYDVDIVPHRKKRSNNANRMYWSIAGLLAQKLNIPVDEVYQHHIQDMSVYNVVCYMDETEDAMRRMWCKGHDGRAFVVLGPTGTQPGWSFARAYFGSSDFDTAQMSRLIDNLLQDCKDQGVDVPPSDKIQALLKEWKPST